MRHRNRVRSANLFLVAAVICSIAIVRPTLIYGGPCQDAASAAYNDACDECSSTYQATVDRATATYNSTTSEAQGIYDDATTIYDAGVAGCGWQLTIELAVIDAGLLRALAGYSTDFAACVTACGVIGLAGVTAPLFLECSDACLGTYTYNCAMATATAAGLAVAAYAQYYLACIAPVQTQYDVASANYDKATGDASTARFDTFTSASATLWDCCETVRRAMEEAIAACPPDDGGDGGDGE